MLIRTNGFMRGSSTLLRPGMMPHKLNTHNTNTTQTNKAGLVNVILSLRNESTTNVPELQRENTESSWRRSANGDRKHRLMFVDEHRFINTLIRNNNRQNHV